jgi:hypothetical protein
MASQPSTVPLFLSQHIRLHLVPVGISTAHGFILTADESLNRHRSSRRNEIENGLPPVASYRATRRICSACGIWLWGSGLCLLGLSGAIHSAAAVGDGQPEPIDLPFFAPLASDEPDDQRSRCGYPMARAWVPESTNVFKPGNKTGLSKSPIVC